MGHPQRFYKYLAPDVARLVLESGTLRWSSPLLFDDETEFQRMPRFEPPIDNSYGACVEALVAIATGRHKPIRDLSPASRRLLQLFELMLANGTSEDELRSIADEPITGSDHRTLEALRNWVESLNVSSARVLCVSVDGDNEDLWVRYGGNHTGVVLELRHLPEEDSPLIAAQRVHYSDAPPIVGEGTDFLIYGGSKELNTRTCDAILFTKSAQWSCQKEWRAVTWRPDENTTYGQYRFVPEELASIKFGRAASRELRASLSTLIRNKYPHCPIEFYGAST